MSRPHSIDSRLPIARGPKQDSAAAFLEQGIHILVHANTVAGHDRIMEQRHVKLARILVAEDHQLVLQRVRVLLQSNFDVVGHARTGREMVSEAIRLRPDLIVADIGMPELSGIEAARELRREGLAIKFVFLTIYPQDAFLDACIAEGALGYVVKSHMNTDLIPAINAALSGRLFLSGV